MSEMLKVKVEGHIAIVTLDNPPLNVITRTLVHEIVTQFDHLSNDSEVRVVVLTGAGERAFSAGGDVKSTVTVTRENMGDLVKTGRAAFTAIRECSVPVIGAINGYALGGGLAIAASCDILVASERAIFGLPEIQTGTWPMFKYLRRLVPEHRMRRMLFTGQRISAKELQSYGSLECVVPHEQLMPTALQLAQEIAEKSSFIIRLYKEAFNKTEFLGIKESLPVELECVCRLIEHPDSKNLRQSFHGKR